MDHLLLQLIRHTRSRAARGVLWAIFALLLILGALHLATFCVGLFDKNNQDRKMIISGLSWLSHWPWWLTVILLALVIVALSAGQILDALVRSSIIRMAVTPLENEMALPLLSGEVKRFQVLDARNLTAEEFKELEEDFRRDTGMFYYIALVQITSRKFPSRTFNWRFTVRSKEGHMVPFAPVAKQWGAPSSWPKVDYCTLDEVENAYLKEDQVYNVFLHLESTRGLASTLDLNSFEARFTDSNNREVVCTMTGARNERRSSDANGLRVEIARFEALASGDPQYYSSRIKILDVVNNGATFVALLTLEASEHYSAIAKNWSFSGRMKDGVRFAIKVVDYGLAAPPHWNRGLEPFSVVDGVRIAKGSLHRVYVHLGVKPQDVDPDWLMASYDDDSGRRTVIYDRCAP